MPRTDPPPIDPAAAPRAAWARFRWYHLYFLLALFDLGVILASIALYHQSLAAFRLALSELSQVDQSLRGLRDIRVAMVEINAPGNDIFESRDVGGEQRRFEGLKDRVEQLIARGRGNHELGSFRHHLASMLDSEARIFERFQVLATPGLPDAEARTAFDQASALMATMDRFQAGALRDLALVETTLRDRQEGLLEDYAATLTHSTRIERVFFLTVVLVLIGIFWYGRELQRADERMVAHREQALAERQARFAAIGEVCSTVAHGIRNPLAGISAAAQVARELAPEGPLGESLADIVFESRRLEERADRLLDFANPLQPRLEDCPLGEILRPVARGLQAQAMESGVNVVVKLENDALMVRADPHMLTEVLYELGTNSLRAMRDGGELRLCVAQGGARAVVRVEDTGCGIPDAVRARLFELFFTTRPDGTGMGLASCRKLLELQGGRVELESSGPGGSVFRVDLPLAA